MKKQSFFIIIILLLGAFNTLGQITDTAKSNTSKFIGGLIRDCDDRITMYLAPAGGTKNKDIDLKKYKQWDLTTQYLSSDWNKYRQGNQGSCTSFAVAFAVSIQRNIDNWLLRRSNKLVQYSPSFIFNIAKSKYRDPFRSACQEGISFIDAYLVVKNDGLSTIQTCPYQTTSDGCHITYYPNKVAYKEAKNMRIGNFQRPFVKKDIFKTLLVDTPFNPICIGVFLSSAYDRACNNGGKWVEPGVSDGKTAHAMLVVGFDDSRNAFKVLDWRGGDSGDKGVIWMDYSLIENPRVVFDAYIVSHSTEYLDPKTGSTTGAADDIDKVGKFSFWIKSGYKTEKDILSISCNYLNVNTQRATFKINNVNTGELIKDDLFLKVGGESQCFSYNGNNYKFKLVEIGLRGDKRNIFNRYAAVILLEKNTSNCI
ncbi:C1 family peptidase [Pedobacter nutrimenti]|uniref:C1 family peptidase n=1 Tax=Pedobacter nutrimenti TaxID=1241337 RepID=UPI00292EE3FC|nr:C1 family peptidase [Pedobacter nutrimenti]